MRTSRPVADRGGDVGPPGLGSQMDDSGLRRVASFRRRRLLTAVLGMAFASVPLACLFVVGGALGASGEQSRASRAYRIVTTMTGPNIPSTPVWVGDLGWVGDGRFYFADVSNKQVDVFGAQRLRFVGAASGFAFPSAIANVGSAVWATDGDSTVKVIDPRTLRIRASIATHGEARADDLAWDPVDNVVVVVNSGDTPPFLSFIKPATRKLAGRLSLPSATDVGQPIWDPGRRLFFVPVAVAKGGAILGVSPSSRRIVRTYHIPCAPSGFVLGPSEEAAIACDSGALIVELGRRGRIAKRFSKLAAGDQVAYDSGLRRYYLTVAVHTSSASIAVIDAVSHRQIGGWKVGTLTHSLGVDSVTHRVFVPGSTGVTVYAPKK